MTPSPNPRLAAPPLVWWTVWASMLGLVMVVGGLLRDQPSIASLPWVMALGPLILGMMMRFLMLPRATNRNKAYVIFIVGLSLCEMTGFLGIFATDQHQDTLLLLALLGIVVHMPTFLRKLPPA